MHNRVLALTLVFVVCLATVPRAVPQDPDAPASEPFQPRVGQEGKDVVWVPTSPELLDVMLDMAGVTASDFVMDLGSGDGRNIIAAAKRGARGRGVEYNPDMVTLSRRLANEAGVSDKAEFVEGDMYVADVSQADVLALFLLPSNLDRLVENFLAMKPGSRIVVNTFGITGWTPDRREVLPSPPCSSWCTAMLYIVPANVAGTWEWDNARLTLLQQFQVPSGALATAGGPPQTVTEGKIEGRRLTFSAGGRTYTGEISGNEIRGTVREGTLERAWTAKRSAPPV